MELASTRPETYPRRILLAVTGLSPQIVTETVYALAVQRSPGRRFIPTSIHLITTGVGRRQAINNLLSEKPGWFHRLRADYGLPEIEFNPDCIHVALDATGRPMDDIRTPQDNERAADFITEKVRELTCDNGAALHVSLAGGRKTMGFYVGYALSLFARPQDRLSHVLVSAPYESHPDFYYPPPSERILQIGGQAPVALDAHVAEVSLAEIPIVSLRHGLPLQLLKGTATFKATVDSAQEALGPPELVLDPKNRCIRAAGRIIKLDPAQFALLAVLAYRTVHGKPPICAPLRDKRDEQWSRDFLEDLRACLGWDVPPSVEMALSRGVDGGYFSPHLTKLEKCITEKLGPAAAPYIIERVEGKGRRRRYKLSVPPTSIRFDHIAGSVAAGAGASSAIPSPRTEK
jgi:CRISPR-associated protein (TIGR02584 family)